MTNLPGDLQSRAPSSESNTSHVAPSSSSNARGARDRLAKLILAASRAREGSGDEHSNGELRRSVESFVTALRDSGASVEHAVIATKELLAETMGGPNLSPERRALAEQVVSWGIEAYYGAPGNRAD